MARWWTNVCIQKSVRRRGGSSAIRCRVCRFPVVMGNLSCLHLVKPTYRMPPRMTLSVIFNRSMSPYLVIACMAFGLVAGCGNQIGDSCSGSSDCSPNGDRFCDNTQPDGYCTIVGCDFNSCPEEAVCVRFFSGGFVNRTCDPATEDVATDMCSFDEVCSLDRVCSPKSSETRECLLSCSSNGDCRDGYECRDLDLMRLHGGEPVLEPGVVLGSNPKRFCAAAPLQQ
jgi:hypothetical protein